MYSVFNQTGEFPEKPQKEMYISPGRHFWNVIIISYFILFLLCHPAGHLLSCPFRQYDFFI